MCPIYLYLYLCSPCICICICHIFMRIWAFVFCHHRTRLHSHFPTADNEYLCFCCLRLPSWGSSYLLFSIEWKKRRNTEYDVVTSDSQVGWWVLRSNHNCELTRQSSCGKARKNTTDKLPAWQKTCKLVIVVPTPWPETHLCVADLTMESLISPPRSFVKKMPSVLFQICTSDNQALLEFCIVWDLTKKTYKHNLGFVCLYSLIIFNDQIIKFAPNNALWVYQ